MTRGCGPRRLFLPSGHVDPVEAGGVLRLEHNDARGHEGTVGVEAVVKVWLTSPCPATSPGNIARDQDLTPA